MVMFQLLMLFLVALVLPLAAMFMAWSIMGM